MLRPNGEECNHGATPILAWRTHSGRLAWFPKPPRRLLRKAVLSGPEGSDPGRASGGIPHSRTAGRGRAEPGDLQPRVHAGSLAVRRDVGRSSRRPRRLDHLSELPHHQCDPFCMGFWPVRYLRVPILVLNALMVASTPTAGSHYFIDIVGGTAVAFLAIVAVNGCRRACAASPTMHSKSGRPTISTNQYSSSIEPIR